MKLWIFFERGAPKEKFDETYRRPETSPRIECTYHLSDTELERVEATGNKNLRDYIAAHGFRFVRGRGHEDDFDSLKYVEPPELDKIVQGIRAARALAADAGEEPEEFNFNWLFDARPDFIFYSSFTDYILPNKITKAQLGENQAVEDFQKVFSIDFTALLEDTNTASRNRKITIVNRSASDNLNSYWSQVLEDEPTAYDFAIDANIHPGIPNESVITFLIDQGDDCPLHFGQKSKGFQWFSSFNLRLRAHEATADNLSEFILLIDEPGQGLHEEAQSDAKKILNEIADKGVQILFTTHQPQLLKDGNDVTLSRIKLVIKSKAEGTKIKNTAQQTSQGGFKDALSPVRTAMGLISLDVSSFLGNRKTVVVEGITDYYYAKAFVYAHKIVDVELIPSTGVTQVPNIFSILNGWGVKAKAMVDDDAPGTKALNDISKTFFFDADKNVVDSALYQNKNCKGIEDTFSAPDFLKFAGPNLPSKPAGKLNSELAKHNSAKEIIARNFYDKVVKGELKLSDFDADTKRNIKQIVDFLKK